MSLPNPINVTYVSPSVDDTFPFQYIVKDTDNIINIDTTNGAVDVILRNIRNSGLLQYQPLLSINDGGNNASVNNITIYPSGGDVLNDSESFVINTDGGNSVLTISNIDQWLTTSSQSSGGGGTLLDGLSYTYVYGNGVDALENGQQLLDGYEEASSKVTTYNPTIDYGALSIVSEDDYYWYSEPLNTALLEPYFSNGQLVLYEPLILTLDGVNYIARLNSIGIDYVFYGYLSDPSPAIGSYESALVTDFYISVNKSILIVGAGYYTIPSDSVRLNLSNGYVDVVSLTGNCDVFLSTYDGNSYPILVETDNIYVRGINTGSESIYIDGDYPSLVMENCIGGEGSFSGNANVLSGKFINCVGGEYSFGGDTADCSGTFIDCVSGNYSFASGTNRNANGTFTNCVAGNYSFGGEQADGLFHNCKAQTFSFGYDESCNGTFYYCKGDVNSFGSNGCGGDFYNCEGAEYSFGGQNGSFGNYYNCVGTNYCFGSNASGNFYNCVGGNYCFGGGEFGNASGNFYNCTSQNQSFGFLNSNGYFYNCIGGFASFGSAVDCNVNGYFENCVSTDYGFGAYTTGAIAGTFLNCRGGDYSFGGNAVNISGNFYNCVGGLYSFGGSQGDGNGRSASGYFYSCIGKNYSFGGGNNVVANGTFINCIGESYAFGGDGGNASGTFTNCVGGLGCFGGYGSSSGKFTYCVGGVVSFSSISSTAVLSYCKLTDGTFPTVASGGITRYCLDGNNATNNQG